MPIVTSLGELAGSVVGLSHAHARPAPNANADGGATAGNSRRYSATAAIWSNAGATS